MTTAMQEQQEFPLPAAFEQLLARLDDDRRAFLKTAEGTLADPKKHAQWLGNVLLGRIGEAVRLLARGMVEAHLLGLGTQTDQSRLRVYILGKLRELGADIDPEAYQGMFPNDAVKSLSDSFAALGLYMAEAYPNDQRLADLYNAAQAALLNLLGASLEDPDAGDGTDGGEGGEGDGKTPPSGNGQAPPAEG